MAIPFRSLLRTGALKIPNRVFGAGGRGRMFPIMEAVMELPEFLVSSGSRARRTHNQAVRFAMKKEALFHHKVRIPEHFDRFRQRKYNYAERSERTKAIKRRRNQADLVKTKRTRQQMTSAVRLQFRRGGPRGAVLLRGVMRWPPGFKFNTRARQGVTPEVMADEITRWTLREERTAASHVIDNYVAEMNRNLSKRAKRAVAGKLQRLGIRV